MEWRAIGLVQACEECGAVRAAFNSRRDPPKRIDCRRTHHDMREITRKGDLLEQRAVIDNC